MGQGGQNSIRGPNSINKYGPIGTLSMGFLILYLTLDLDNIMHEYCYWTKCRSMLVSNYFFFLNFFFHKLFFWELELILLELLT